MIRDRVNDVISDWCGRAQPDPTTRLSDQWEATRNNGHDGIVFQPDGVDLLLGKLVAEFRKPGNVRKDVSTLKAGNFKPDGTIDTIDDLVNAVVGCLNLPAAGGAGGE